MKLDGQLKDLFDAFSRINKEAFKDERLISNHVLSRAPNYGDILRRFLLREPITPLTPKDWLRQALKYLIFNLGHFAFILCARAAIFLSGFKAADIQSLAAQRQPLLLLDSFMLLPKVASDGKYREMYLPGLQLEGKLRVNILRLYGSRNPLTVYKAFKALSLQNEHEDEPFLAVSDIQLLSLGDFGRLLRHILLFPLSLRKLLLNIGIPGTGSAEAYIKESLCGCAGQCYLIPEARRLSAIALASMLKGKDSPERNHTALRESRLVSWHENQPVNKAFYYGLRQGFGQHPESYSENSSPTGHSNASLQMPAEIQGAKSLPIPVIGAQLFIWPDNLLNCHHDPVEAQMGLAPERILFCGPYFLPEADSAGLKPDEPPTAQRATPTAANPASDAKPLPHFQVGPALRYAKLFDRIEAVAGPIRSHTMQPSAPSDSIKIVSHQPQQGEAPLPGIATAASHPDLTPPSGTILVLLSYHPDETRRVLELVKPLADKGLDLRYRFHPASRPADFAALLPDNYKSADGDLYNVLESIKGSALLQQATGNETPVKASGLVIGSGSGSLAEAVALGVPAVNIDDPSGVAGLALNYLPPFGKGLLWENARNLAELEAARSKLQAAATVLPASEYAALTAEFRSMLFTKPDAENISNAFN